MTRRERPTARDVPRTMIRIGTRGSALALAQADLVGRALADHGIDHQIIVIETAGDRRAPDTAWGEGAFVTAIERALVGGQVDAAVHSAKDVPTDEDPRLRIAAYLPRAEPRDALVLPTGLVGSLDTLASGTVIGTDSPRRAGFLRAHRADLDIRPLHGNVDTRLRRLDEGAVGALVLAAAGLLRLERAERISQLLPIQILPPAPGQGALAVQIRAADAVLGELLSALDDDPTRHAVETERAFLRATGGGCRAPVGALATIEGDLLQLHGGFATIDGRAVGLEHVEGPVGERIALAERLAGDLVARRAQLPGAPRVLITRPLYEARQLAGRLAEHGMAGLVVPAIAIEPAGGSDLEAALVALTDYEWAVVTSANGAHAVGSAAARLGIDLGVTRWAAVGQTSARALLAAGVKDVWLPSQSSATALAEELPVASGERVLWTRGDLAEDTLSDRLRQRGIEVRAITVYRTVEAPAGSRTLLAKVLEHGPIDAVILASPSAARGLLDLAAPAHRSAVRAIPAICVGPRTAAAARAEGFDVIGQPATQDATALAEVAAELLARVPPTSKTAGVLSEQGRR